MFIYNMFAFYAFKSLYVDSIHISQTISHKEGKQDVWKLRPFIDKKSFMCFYLLNETVQSTFALTRTHL